MGTSFDRLTYEQIIGMPWDELVASQDPRVATLMSALVRELGGNFWLLAGALIVAVSVTSYRRGEKWAWYALWILPLHAALDMATVAGYGGLSMASATWDMALVVSTILALLLPYRRFFP